MLIVGVMLQELLPNETRMMRGLRNLGEDHGQATKDAERQGQGTDLTAFSMASGVLDKTAPSRPVRSTR